MAKITEYIKNISIILGIYLTLTTAADVGAFNALDAIVIYEHTLVQAVVFYGFWVVIAVGAYGLINDVKTGAIKLTEIPDIVSETMELLPNVDEHSAKNYSKQMQKSLLGDKGTRAVTKAKEWKKWGESKGLKINAIGKQESCITINDHDFPAYSHPVDIYKFIIKKIPKSAHIFAVDTKEIGQARVPLSITPISPLSSGGYESLEKSNVKQMILAIVFFISVGIIYYLSTTGVLIL